MSAQEERDELDGLVRHVQQMTKDWPERPVRLAVALAAGAQASNVGVDVAHALEELQGAWAEAAASPVDPEGSA